MLGITKTINVARCAEDCFLYLSDLQNLIEWDPAVSATRKDSTGPVAKGSYFTVRVAIGALSVPFRYIITEHNPHERIVIAGRSSFLNVNDTIELSESDGRTTISYRAEFHFKLGLERLFPSLADALDRQCQLAIDRLETALTATADEAVLSARNAKADTKTLSALRTFTRHGYVTGRKVWAPMSERMEGRRVVLTGANSGIGLAAAIDLASAGASLTLVVRDEAKAAQTAKSIKEATGRTDIEFEFGDLSLLKDTDALIDRLLAKGDTIDVLINNAGALFNDHTMTSEGLEKSYALLLLSPWRLCERLLPLLKNHDETARVINVVSGGMYAERLNLKRLNMTSDGYRGARAYAQCKRALSIMTEVWAERWQDHNIVVNAMHPGWSDTPGVQKSLPLFRRLTRLVLRSHAEGADTVVWMARSNQAALSTGKLFLDREPRSTYLLGNNVESQEDRKALEPRLQHDFESTLKATLS
ncbi:MAG: SDR family NAD(P)-dependent oxidoreductase [Pseudomonadota bacterium]|nr:SDR family NAD(P)-dependent oxidoreductase [Pseudomonadota bacterium]